MTKANDINTVRNLNTGNIEPGAGKFWERAVLFANESGSVEDQAEKILSPDSQHQRSESIQELDSRRASYDKGLKVAIGELELKKSDEIKCYADGYALVSEKYGDKAIEIYKNAYIYCTEVSGKNCTGLSGKSVKDATDEAQHFAQFFTVGHRSVSRQHKPTVAKIYDEAFQRAMWSENSTPEDTKKYALDSVESFDNDCKSFGNNTAEIYEKAFLKAIGNPNGTMENARTYAMNSAKGYSYAVENNIPNSERYATLYADYIDNNVGMEDDIAIKASAYARASVWVSAHRMDPGEYAKVYFQAYEGKFDELVSLGIGSNHAHSLARGYAYASVELGYNVTSANFFAERYAYASEHGFSDEQARTFPFVQSIYDSTFGKFNFSEEFGNFIMKDLANAYLEAEKRAVIFHKRPEKMGGYVWAYTNRYAQERAKYIAEASGAPGIMPGLVRDNIGDRSSAEVVARIATDEWLKENTSAGEGASRRLGIVLNGFHPASSNLSKAYNEGEDEVENSFSELSDEYNKGEGEGENSFSELSDEYNEGEDEDYILEFPEIRMDNTN
jgi:hypothetical protein